MDYFPRIKLERFPMSDAERFELKLKFRNITLDNEGHLVFWVDASEIEKLQADCTCALMEEDDANVCYDHKRDAQSPSTTPVE
jgi:hypothetical protein